MQEPARMSTVLSRVRSNVRWAGTAAVVLVSSAVGARGQSATGSLRGFVIDTAGNPVAYALVQVAPPSSERFTDERGTFATTGLGAGTYRVRVRQVGYQPFDSSVTVTAAGPPLRIVLHPLAIRLDELTVSAAGRCTDPSLDRSPRSPELSAILGQLRENAVRFAVLADSYPFVYAIERRFSDVGVDGRVLWSAVDTVEYRSDGRAHYRPGNVVGLATWPLFGAVHALQLPSVADLADSTFQANHCLEFTGVRSEGGGQRRLRIAFRASESLAGADVDGEADLDAESYQLRHLLIRLSRPERAMPGLAGSSADVTLRELYPNVLVVSAVRGSLVPVHSIAGSFGRARQVTEFREQQRLIRIRFLRPLPSGSTRSP